MRSTLVLVLALGFGLQGPAPAQTLSSRLEGVRDGTVRFSFATRPAICGNARFIGEETGAGFVTYTVWDRGYSLQTYEFFQPACERGPMRVVVVKEGGLVTALRAAVAVDWRSGLESADLGMVSGTEAAAWLLDRASSAWEQVGIVAFLAANAADAPIADRLIRMATDRSLPDAVRFRAMRWANGAAAREGKSAEADFALRTIAMADAESPGVRDRAIRSLRSSPSNDAFLTELYDRLDRPALKDRIIRRVAEHPSDRAAAWLRGIALDRAEPREARDRALRVLGGELNRMDDVRAIYGQLDHASLKDRLLRLAGERGDSATVVWLRDVALDAREATGLRDRALRVLAERAIATVELATLYDRVGANQLKQRVIRLLADRRDEAAVDKLIAIAQSDANSDLRRYATRRLADTGHPKAKAYLEETLRRP